MGGRFDMVISLKRLRTLPRRTTVAYADAEAARRCSMCWRVNGVFRGGTESDSTPRAFQPPDRSSRPDARWLQRGSLASTLAVRQGGAGARPARRSACANRTGHMVQRLEVGAPPAEPAVHAPVPGCSRQNARYGPCLPPSTKARRNGATIGGSSSIRCGRRRTLRTLDRSVPRENGIFRRPLPYRAPVESIAHDPGPRFRPASSARSQGRAGAGTPCGSGWRQHATA